MHLAPAQQMHMQMIHRLPTLRARRNHHPIPLAQPLLARNLRHGQQQPSQQRFILGFGIGQRSEVLLRNPPECASAPSARCRRTPAPHRPHAPSSKESCRRRFCRRCSPSVLPRSEAQVNARHRLRVQPPRVRRQLRLPEVRRLRIYAPILHPQAEIPRHQRHVNARAEVHSRPHAYGARLPAVQRGRVDHGMIPPIANGWIPSARAPCT